MSGALNLCTLWRGTRSEHCACAGLCSNLNSHNWWPASQRRCRDGRGQVCVRQACTGCCEQADTHIVTCVYVWCLWPAGRLPSVLPSSRRPMRRVWQQQRQQSRLPRQQPQPSCCRIVARRCGAAGGPWLLVLAVHVSGCVSSKQQWQACSPTSRQTL